MWKWITRAMLAALVAGCVSEPGEWAAVTAVATDSLPGPGVVSAATGYPYRMNTAGPPDPGMCPRSIAYAGDPRGKALTYPLFAAWLRLRPDSTVAVVASRYGGASKPHRWDATVVVDSLDVGKFGCERPGPSIAVTNQNVHVSYSLQAPEGYGVFFAHSMDDGASFHSPLIIVYGDRLSATATAAENRRVVVAYDAPSGTARRIDVAVSNTDGHTFEPRVHGSPDGVSATLPRVAVNGDTVALSFASGDGTARVVRIGRFRRN
jgi:hypothetical protein